MAGEQALTAPIARRCMLIGGLTLALTALGRQAAVGASKPIVSVHKSPT